VIIQLEICIDRLLSAFLQLITIGLEMLNVVRIHQTIKDILQTPIFKAPFLGLNISAVSRRKGLKARLRQIEQGDDKGARLQRTAPDE